MVALDKEYREGISCGDWRSFRTVSCEAGFCAAAGQVKNDLACETHLKFHFAGLSSTQLMVLRCQNSIANTT